VLLARPPQQQSGDKECKREGGDTYSANSYYSLIIACRPREKIFPIIITFLIIGPAIGLLLAVFIHFWLGAAIVGIWFI
jgi:hypothetical protein